jgi:hypothetical protein
LYVNRVQIYGASFFIFVVVPQLVFLGPFLRSESQFLFNVFLSGSQSILRFVSGLTSTPLGWFVIVLASKPLGQFVSGLASKPLGQFLPVQPQNRWR